MIIDPIELIGKTITDAHIDMSPLSYTNKLILEMSDGCKVVVSIDMDSHDEPMIILSKEFI